MDRPIICTARLPLGFICAMFAIGADAASLAYFKQNVVVADGEYLQQLIVDDGHVALASGARADAVEVINGGVMAASSSEAKSIIVRNGSLKLAGTVGEYVYCGNGELQILSGARIHGRIENYHCRISIEQGAVVDASIHNFAGEVELHKSARFAGALHFLRAVDTVDEFPDRIVLKLGRDAHIEGALVTHRCIGIKLARGATIAEQRGIAARHIGLRRRASDPYRSCQELSTPLLAADTSAQAKRDIHLGSGVSLSADSTQTIHVLNGGIRVNTGVSAGALETVNGSVELEPKARALSARIFNGAIKLEHGAQLDHGVAIANGNIFLDADSAVGGSAHTDVGAIFISFRARVAGVLGNRIGNVVLLPGAEIGALHFASFADSKLKERRADSLHIHRDVRILGEITFDRPINVYIANGVAMPAFTGIPPRIREADERMYENDALGYAKDAKCVDSCAREAAQ